MRGTVADALELCDEAEKKRRMEPAGSRGTCAVTAKACSGEGVRRVRIADEEALDEVKDDADDDKNTEDGDGEDKDVEDEDGNDEHVENGV